MLKNLVATVVIFVVVMMSGMVPVPVAVAGEMEYCDIVATYAKNLVLDRHSARCWQPKDLMGVCVPERTAEANKKLLAIYPDGNVMIENQDWYKELTTKVVKSSLQVPIRHDQRGQSAHATAVYDEIFMWCLE